MFQIVAKMNIEYNIKSIEFAQYYFLVSEQSSPIILFHFDILISVYKLTIHTNIKPNNQGVEPLYLVSHILLSEKNFVKSMNKAINFCYK